MDTLREMKAGSSQLSDFPMFVWINIGVVVSCMGITSQSRGGMPSFGELYTYNATKPSTGFE